MEEFDAVYEEWNTLETARYRTSWEQTRFIAHCSLMPHTKKGFSPTDLIRFEWDNETKRMLRPTTLDDFERIRKQFE